jgi:hypothetical protein
MHLSRGTGWPSVDENPLAILYECADLANLSVGTHMYKTWMFVAPQVIIPRSLAHEIVYKFHRIVANP